jgi:hypothetical protein
LLQTIFEDGKEIISSTSLLATEFGHSWNSENSLHIFRIEANLSMTSEHTYMFLIDGQRFIDMPRKPIAGRRSSTLEQSSYESKSPSSAATHNRRASTNSVPGPDRSHFQSPKQQDSKTFDPFASTSSEDLFQSNSPTVSQNTRKSASSAASKSKPIAAAPVGNLLDDFDTPAPVATKPATASSSNFFDDFDAKPSPAAKPAPSNGFADFPTNFNSSFASTTSNPPAASGTSNQGFAMFAGDAFATTPVSVNGSHASLTASVSPSAASNSNNAFDAFPSNSFDPFSSQPTSAATNMNSKPGRRTSAQEIVQDFAGLTIAPTAAAPVVDHAPEPVAQAVSSPDDSRKSAEPVNPRIWDSNLVNLDLTGLSDRSKTVEKPIRASITATTGNTPIMRTPPPANSLNAAMGMPMSMHPNQPPSPASTIPSAGFGAMPPQPQPLPMSRPTNSNAPVNPFASGFAISSNVAPSSVTRGAPSGGAPLDPFQALPSLAGFQGSSNQPKTYESVAPLSAIASKSSYAAGAPSAMTNNAMKSAPLSSAQRPQAAPATSLDALNWKS